MASDQYQSGYDRRTVRTDMIRAITNAHDNPAEWARAVRLIAEKAGVDPATFVSFCGTTLNSQCHDVVEAAMRGANDGGIGALLDAIARYHRSLSCSQ